MQRPLVSAAALAVLSACILLPSPARAAESYDNCIGTIASVPVVIAAQGVWCLKGNLASSVTSGDLILVTTNNVTIDCNGFKLGGLSAGPTSLTKGISAPDRNNVTVRNCDIRGFDTGISMPGELGGHLVEDNRLEGNLRTGIELQGSRNVARRNRVYDTGGGVTAANVTAILVSGDAIDNIIDGVIAVSDSYYALGIGLGDIGSVARGNHVRNLSGGVQVGIDVYGANAVVNDNVIVNETPQVGRGVWGTTGTFCTANMVAGFTIEGITGCDLVAGNSVH
jgi:hypothetical protein